MQFYTNTGKISISFETSPHSRIPITILGMAKMPTLIRGFRGRPSPATHAISKRRQCRVCRVGTHHKPAEGPFYLQKKGKSLLREL